MSNGDRKNGVPTTVTSIPLVDPTAMPANPSIGDLVKDATTQVSTLVRAEVELAKAEITRDVRKGLTGSVFFILALVVLLYSTFFMFFFLAFGISEHRRIASGQASSKRMARIQLASPFSDSFPASSSGAFISASASSL